MRCQSRSARRGAYPAWVILAFFIMPTTDPAAAYDSTADPIAFSSAHVHIDHSLFATADPATFWQRSDKIVSSIKIMVGIILLSYTVKLVVWLIERVVRRLNRVLLAGRFSIRRIGTLLGFAGSIAKLFIWLFGIVWILSEFGISPATTSGAIGLIGLILAGMFQQIVIDFVKGLDIIAGRHYNVGDFVEVNGQFGHVIDFNVKYTRIRTASGQESNIPNSLCLPSRRFPDGYVNNYVDFTVASAQDEQRLKDALLPICRDMNNRIEYIRDVPTIAWRFDKPTGRLTIRYRLSVLPGCDWVVKEYFLPAARKAIVDAGIELAGEPTFMFINRIQTFRKLFNRQLSEEEIIKETATAPTPPMVPTC